MPTLGEVDEQLEAASTKQAATPKDSDIAASSIPDDVRTPTSKVPIEPSRIEMHPHHHQYSTAKPLDEARWLGFQNMGARTEPVKKGASKIPITQATPTKSQEVTTTFSTPEFKFRFRRPSLDLSPEAKKLMEESRKEAEKIRAQMAANPEKFGFEKTEDIARRMATPKSKTSRFSAAHMAEFKKMDSIANHPSAFRANRDGLQPANAPLKRSPSKAELDKPEQSSGKLVRTKSAATLRKAEIDSKANPAKRVKHNKEDDASASRSKVENRVGTKPSAHKSAVGARGNASLPRSLSHLTTPTKASLARSQSVKTLKKTSLIPTLAKSPSAQAPQTPSKTPSSFMDGLRKASKTVSRLPSMKSILRSPVRHYSNDPTKIAAGTHVASPPDLNKDPPDVPATAPVQKRVVFSESTLVRNENDEPMNTHALPEAPQNAPAEVQYPKLPALSPARRSTMGAGDFTFRSDKTIKFGSGVKGPTIRHVRGSDASSALPDPFNTSIATPAKKRKVDVPSEITESEKENEDEEGSRPAKRAKSSTKTLNTPKKPEVGSKTPRRKTAGRGALSQARLNLLAQPKRRA